MPSSLSQNSFAGGELTPSAWGRVDLARYQNSLKTCRNFIVRVAGGVVNRTGTAFVCKLRDMTKKGRIIPFQFSTSQGYCLQFENGWLRVVKDGGQVLFSSGPSIGLPFEVASPYTDAHLRGDSTISPPLPRVKRTQLADVMTLSSNAVRPKNLSRTAHDAWTFSDMAFNEGPILDINTNKTITVTVSAQTGAITITASSAIFTAAHVGQLFYIEQKNFGVPWEVAKAVSTNDIRRSEGKYYKALDTATTGTLRPVGEDPGISESDGAVRWEYQHSGYGIALITAIGGGGTTATATVLLMMPSDLTSEDSYKWAFGAWGGDQGWPGAVAYYQQRRTLAATPAKPSHIWNSATNGFDRFGKSTPIKDNDAVNLQLAGKEVNAIQHLFEMNRLIVLTAADAADVEPALIGGGKWVIPGDDNNPILTPSQRSARQSPDSALFISANSQKIFDIQYDFSSNGFPGREVAILGEHLLKGRAIVAAAYQTNPFRCFWMVQDDGALLGLTYLREHEVYAMHRHDTDGFFEDVCVVSEPPEDAVYFIVRRNVNEQTVRYIERLKSRLYTDIRDAVFLDSSLTYDGRNKTATTMKLISIGGGWEYDSGETFRLDASADYFSVSHVGGDEIHMTGEDGRILRMKIANYINPKQVNVTLNRDAAVEFRNIPTAAWGHARKDFTGVDHLEGKTVAALADGHVVRDLLVDEAEVSIPFAAVVVHIGLPIIADFETLDMNVLGQETIRDKQKIVPKVTLLVEESRGIFAGENFENLMEYGQRNEENYDDPVELLTGQAEIHIPATWGKGGRVCVRQSDPLPLSILGAIPTVEVGGSA